MAIIKNGYLRGQIGNVVNRKVGSLNVIQTKPSNKIRQTKWTQAAASDFGTASAAGAVVRRACNSVHRNVHDNEMHNRLVKCMLRVLRGNGKRLQGLLQIKYGNIQRLVDFQFNESCHIYDYIYFTPLVSFAENGSTTIEIPALKTQENFSIPKGCNHLIFKVDVVGLNFGSKYGTTFGNLEIELARHGDANTHTSPQTHFFDTMNERYDSIIVTLSTLYLSHEGSFSVLLNSDSLNPAGIIAAYNPKK